MKTITVRVVGGLGNQMHCYAFGRAVAAHNHAMLKLDIESGFWSDPYKRTFLLKEFPNLQARYCSFSDNTQQARFVFKASLKIRSLISKPLPLELKPVVVEERPPHYQAEIHRTRYALNPYFMGHWASYRYCQDIEAELRHEMRPPMPKHPAALQLLSEIRKEISCSIHWRSYEEEVHVQHPSLREYYQQAIELITARYPGVNFYVFSDNPAKAQKELALPDGGATFVDISYADDLDGCLSDFFLMYSCDHAIIGDSTFSWWAAWLGDEGNRTVIAPQGLSPWGDDWAPSHWLTINALTQNTMER